MAYRVNPVCFAFAKGRIASPRLDSGQYMGGTCVAKRYSATVELRREPSLSMVTITSSLGLSQRFGVRPKPTPSGVPVLITSPASRGVVLEM